RSATRPQGNQIAIPPNVASRLSTSPCNQAAGSLCGAIVAPFLNAINSKIVDHLRDTYGIHLTRSACAQIVLRAGRRLQPAYEEIQQHIRQENGLEPVSQLARPERAARG
ncbi:MAG TPA: hypothetical protein VNX28_10395, partial [Gemmataceae bacterium]|nr:hypothetical protein [Gemmataceae bacterium]